MSYLNVTEVESALSVAAGAPYTAFTQLITLPNATWEGRVPHALKIANASASRRTGVCFTGGVHAREWGSPDILIYFMEQVEQAFQAGTGIMLGAKSYTAAQIQKIVNNLDLYIFPQVNPDGRNYSMTTDAWWRKNRRPPPPASSSMGVDINRNYDFLWNFPAYFNPASGVMNSVSPSSDVYIGPSANSEPETQNVIWIMDSFSNIRFFIDLHSYSESILYVWGDDDDQSIDPNMNFQNPAYNGMRGVAGDSAYREYISECDLDNARNLALRMRAGIQAVRGRAYTVEQALSLYPTAGTGHDYAFSREIVSKSKSKILGYTVEWGTEFQPPYAEMQNIIQEVTAGLVEFCLGVLDTTADVYICDNSDDTGAVPYGGVFWDNSDIFVRNADDNILAYQPAVRSQPNYVYVRVTNLGPADSGPVLVSLRAVRYPGTEFIYPNDWTTVDADHIKPATMVGSFSAIPSGATRVAKFSMSPAEIEVLYGWEGAGWHPCVLASVTGCNDFIASTGQHVWESNNLAQRNITVVTVALDSIVRFPFIAGNALNSSELMELLIDRKDLPDTVDLFLDPLEPADYFHVAGNRRKPSACKVTLLDPARFSLKCGETSSLLSLPAGSELSLPAAFHPSVIAMTGAEYVIFAGRQVLSIRAAQSVIRLRREPGTVNTMSLQARMPVGGITGAHRVRVAQRDSRGRISGGVTLELQVPN